MFRGNLPAFLASSFSCNSCSFGFFISVFTGRLFCSSLSKHKWLCPVFLFFHYLRPHNTLHYTSRTAFRPNMKSDSVQYERKRHRTGTSRSYTSRRSGWLRGFGALDPSPHFWIFTSLSVGTSPSSYSFTSATVRIPVHSKTKVAEPIRYVTIFVAQLRPV